MSETPPSLNLPARANFGSMLLEPVGSKSVEHQASSDWIEIDGKKVNVYKSQNEGRVVIAFIKSILGKTFVLCYKLGLSSPPLDIATSAIVDRSE